MTGLPALPVLPPALVAVLGAIATILMGVETVVPEPYKTLITIVLGVLTLIGIPATNRAVKQHALKVAQFNSDGSHSITEVGGAA